MPIKKILLFAIGAVLVIGGITLTIKDWIFIKVVFRGVIGPLLAVIGLVVLTLTRE
jgi:intracellular septation protein A